MKYLEFSFHLVPCSETAGDVLTALLGDAGFESFVSRADGIDAYIRKELFSEDALRRALAQFPLPGVQMAYDRTEPEDRDWNEEWERNSFRPIVIGGRCVIHSPLHTDVPRADYDIVINPQMAFGTGYHETTTLIVEELLDTALIGKRVLDMGCGTSILAILTRMRGAAHVTAIDIDEWCVRNSRENIILNKVECIEVIQGDASTLEGRGPFDLVIANINRNILLADMSRYVRCLSSHGGELLISGFYADDIPLLRQSAETLGLQFAGGREKNRWASLRFCTIYNKV